MCVQMLFLVFVCWLNRQSCFIVTPMHAEAEPRITGPQNSH